MLHQALLHKTVVCVGVGGARSWLENLARAGVGNFVLIDGDRIEAQNTRTQGVFPDEADCYKVDVVAAQLRRIAPHVRTIVLRDFLNDALDDSAFSALVRPVLSRPRDTLIAGCTDCFPAQARTAALALKLGTPYLAAQLYKEGLAGEVFFSYPGVTTGGCARCALESRYRAYLAHGFRNDVTSQGADIFATERINALKGTLALALLLYGEPHTGVYRTLLDTVRSRNLALLRMLPCAADTLRLPLFDTLDQSSLSCFDETIWVEQHPNHPQYGEVRCPLCGGATDLTDLIDQISDTRHIAEGGSL